MVALVLAALAIAGASTARPARAASDPIGAHSMLQLNDPPSFMDAMFAQAAAMHASAIRLDVAPALIFPSQSQPPDFAGLDEVVALAQRYHLQVVADLLTVPPWLAQCATPTNNPSRCAPGDLSAYASLISRIVARADPVIRDWEVWNEPDTAEFFDGTPQQYAFMLRTAHDAIKAVDRTDEVLLGGISDVAGTDWLAQVLATPGADAVTAFDIANLHERGDLWQLAPDLAAFEQFLATEGFTGPLWVTEHGYPADPQYQYDPGYTAGEAAQASFLTASVPTLLDAGASMVFVTERDNLGGAFASEGVLGGDVADPPPADPQIVARPAFSAMANIADCFALLGRDCPGPPATATPATALLPPAPPGHASRSAVTITDPGSVPIKLGVAAMAGPSAPGLAVAADGCAGMVLEPRETCSITVSFAPVMSGDVAGDLQLPTDDGPLNVRALATAPSVSGLRSAELPGARFVPAGAGDGVGYAQRWRLELTNPFRAPVWIGRTMLSGRDARRFRISANHCAQSTLRPHGGCRLVVVFTPTRPGPAAGQLTLQGTGSPLIVPLRPMAFALPAVRRLTISERDGCAAAPGAWVSATVSQSAAVHWTLRRLAGAGRAGCPRPGALAGRTVTSGTVRTGHRARTHLAHWPMPAGLFVAAPSDYVLTAFAVNEHGAGPARVIVVRLGA